MIAISSVEVSGKVYSPGATLPVLPKADAKWLVDNGFAKADAKPEAKRENKKKRGKDDISGSGKR